MHVHPQTPDVDAVSGPACQVLDEHFAKLIPHGDAIVSHPYERVEDLDVMPPGNAEAVRVDVVPWGRDCEALKVTLRLEMQLGCQFLLFLVVMSWMIELLIKFKLRLMRRFRHVLFLLQSFAFHACSPCPSKWSESHIVDGYPLASLVGEFGRVRVCFEVAFSSRLIGALFHPDMCAWLSVQFFLTGIKT